MRDKREGRFAPMGVMPHVTLLVIHLSTLGSTPTEN